MFLHIFQAFLNLDVGLLLVSGEGVKALLSPFQVLPPSLLLLQQLHRYLQLTTLCHSNKCHATISLATHGDKITAAPG